MWYYTKSYNTIKHKHTVQLKGNLIPACMLQVECCWVKIASCIQYLNRHRLHSCLHQANCLACAPANVTLILNELSNKTFNINSIYTMNLQILSLYVLIDPLIHCLTEKLLACSISHVLLFGRMWRMYLVLQ